MNGMWSELMSGGGGLVVGWLVREFQDDLVKLIEKLFALGHAVLDRWIRKISGKVKKKEKTDGGKGQS